MKRSKEAEVIKKTLVYQADVLYNACQKVKEEVMKAYSKPFLIVCEYLNRLFSRIIR